MDLDLQEILASALEGEGITFPQALEVMNCSRDQLPAVVEVARRIRDFRIGRNVTYSRKIFLPLTNICRDKCAYCWFRREPWEKDARILTSKDVLETALLGEKASCKEALLMLGDRPEAKYSEVKQRLRQMGFHSTMEYLVHMASLIVNHTKLLPHSNPGFVTKQEMSQLQPYNVSLGLMLENVSERLCERGGVHVQAVSKHPKLRLAVIEAAGQLGIAFTTGILIGIGETVEERIQSLYALKELHERYHHIQEVIIQNFRNSHGRTIMGCREPSVEDMIRTISVARLIFQGDMNIQAPPNLTPDEYGSFLDAGINDWGGISPVTPDYVNPTSPWPNISELRKVTHAGSYHLRERLPLYPNFIVEHRFPLANALRDRVTSYVDGEGYVRGDLALDD